MKRELNQQEQTFLNLFALNQDSDKISSFMEVKKRDLIAIKKTLKSLFFTDNFSEIITICTDYNYLDYKNFLDNSTKKFCLDYINNYQIENTKCIRKIRKYILNSYSIHNNKKIVKKNNIGLDNSEILFLSHKYNGKTPRQLRKIMSLSAEDYKQKEISILSKLNASNWFNVYKKAYALGIINNFSQEELHIIKNIINNINIKKHKKTTDKENKTMIYDIMVKVYADLEFLSLWKLKFTKQHLPLSVA